MFNMKLHLDVYLLNQYYICKNSVIQNDLYVLDTFIDFVDSIFVGDHTLKNHIMIVELLVYKDKQENFSWKIAIKGCGMNVEKFIQVMHF